MLDPVPFTTVIDTMRKYILFDTKFFIFSTSTPIIGHKGYNTTFNFKNVVLVATLDESEKVYPQVMEIFL
jgi:hypothetical protein